MGAFTIRHEFDCDVETFWKHVFMNQNFNKRMYTGELGFERYEIFEDGYRDDGRFYREVCVQPKAEVPKIVRKVIGDALSYLEKGVWTPEDQRYRYEIIPSTMADRSTIGGMLWAEPVAEGRCARICEMDIRVQVFGVGKIVESFVEKTTRESYEAATKLTHELLEERRAEEG